MVEPLYGIVHFTRRQAGSDHHQSTDMDHDNSDEIEQMRLETSKLVDDLLAHEPAFHRTNQVPDEVDAAFRRLGYYGMRIPEEFGGTALGMRATVGVVRELGRLPPQFWPFLRVALGPSSKSLVRHGSAAQKQRWLPAMAAGECGVAFVLTESEAGSDLAAMRTRAVRAPGGYVLNGAKTYISNADKAGLFVVFAKTDPAASLKASLSTFLVAAGHPGMAIGPAMPTMGATLNGLFEVTFTDCFLPHEALLGEEGHGFAYAMESLNEGRLNVGAIAVGMGQFALELALDHAKTRIVGGQPLAANQAVQHMLTNAAMELHAGWMMVQDAARRLDAGTDASASSAMVKIFCSEAAGRAADMAVQLFGASGYSRGFQVERLYRDVRVLRIYEGASEILRNVVAKKLLSDGCRYL
jgi:alkylation response protein AidB-like acyl-CoA dehydrogenase